MDGALRLPARSSMQSPRLKSNETKKRRFTHPLGQAGVHQIPRCRMACAWPSRDRSPSAPQCSSAESATNLAWTTGWPGGSRRPFRNRPCRCAVEKASAKWPEKSVEAIVEAARCQWKPSGELLALYHKTNDEIIRKFKAAKAMTFPKGDSLKITLVPDFVPRHPYGRPLAARPVRQTAARLLLGERPRPEKNRGRQTGGAPQHFGPS